MWEDDDGMKIGQNFSIPNSKNLDLNSKYGTINSNNSSSISPQNGDSHSMYEFVLKTEFFKNF